ncbi:hypothetical protein M8J77_000126 [Diaphorina citri]|nr:hypothetical protein M8J77_000126 [Diaphorina citri]
MAPGHGKKNKKKEKKKEEEEEEEKKKKKKEKEKKKKKKKKKEEEEEEKKKKKEEKEEEEELKERGSLRLSARDAPNGQKSRYKPRTTLFNFSAPPRLGTKKVKREIHLYHL